MIEKIFDLAVHGRDVWTIAQVKLLKRLLNSGDKEHSSAKKKQASERKKLGC